MLPPSATSRTLQKIQILHSYRALLRATTYLPDSLSRLRIHNTIVNKFHKHSHDALPTSSTHHLLKSTLSRLQRAASFHTKDLTLVLSLTYGRKGTRRRILINDLRRAPEEDVLPDVESLEKFIDSLEGKGKGKERNVVNTKVAALLNSQQENLSQIEKMRLKEARPQIPKENIWGRSTPVKVRKNMAKRWWAKTWKKVAPPVEGEEWARLRDLARGDLVEDVPVRRAGKKEVVLEGEGLLRLEDITERIKGSHHKQEILSERGLRRLYGQIWSQTPMMKWDEESKKWETQWGVESTMIKAGVQAVPRASGGQLELFEGVELLSKPAKNGGGRREKRKEKKNITI